MLSDRNRPGLGDRDQARSHARPASAFRTYVEFEDEVERALADTVDDGLQLCIDTGHFVYAGVDPVRFFVTIGHAPHTCISRTSIRPCITRSLDRRGCLLRCDLVGCVLSGGQGMVDFAALAAELESGFDGPGTIEQDRDFKSTTTALDDAKASLALPARIGIALAT